MDRARYAVDAVVAEGRSLSLHSIEKGSPMALLVDACRSGIGSALRPQPGECE